MKTNKNIDRLFQEKFKELEVIPPKSVWSNIETNLDEKHKAKRGIPLWLRLTSVAAILLLLTIGAINYFDDSKNGVIITDVDPVNTPSDVENTLKNENIIDTNDKSIITDASNKDSELIETLESNTSNEGTSKFNKENNNTIANTSNKSINNNPTSKFEVTSKENIIATEKTLSNNSSTIANNINGDNNSNSSKLTTNSKVLKDNSLSNKNSIFKKLNNTKSNIAVTDTQNSINESVKFDSKINDINKNKENTSVSENNSKDVSLKQALKELNNKDKTEEVVAQSIEKLESLLPNTDSDEEKEKEDAIKKWSVASNVAPIFYNSFNTKGSPLDLQFENSPKTGSKSVSYGVKVGYNLNDKLTLQTGVSKMDVGYRIGDVFINPSQQQQPLARLANVVYSNTGVILNVNAQNFLDDSLVETTSSVPIKGTLDQAFGYIEVPLELKYRLTNTESKMGINLVGGFSTMFLDKNEVFVTTDEFSSNLGKANNLNNVNFSGNLGLDVDYKINKKIFINVAPTLKIHANTFSNGDKNFKPYLFGVYTGLNYRF